jgi:hypothetical protein
MNTTVVCREVRPANGSSKQCVVIAAQDERAGMRTIDPTAPSNLAAVRDRMRAQGIVLGGPLQPARQPGTQSRLASPVQIIAHDEQGHEHRLMADQLEEYSLSTGSTLYYLHVAEAPGDCGWLVGRTLEVAEFRSRSPDIAEQVAVAERPDE